jgi:hypothetical protein
MIDGVGVVLGGDGGTKPAVMVTVPLVPGGLTINIPPEVEPLISILLI